MGKYRYILFDWDGNLAMTLDVWLEALKIPLERRGHSLSDEEIGANFEVFKKRFEAMGHDATAILEEASIIAKKNVPLVELYPDALEVLESLHKSGKQIALITTSLHQQIDPLLKRHGIRQLFNTVICGDDTENIKPHPEPIIKALSELKASPENSVMIGDSENDIQAATSAGVDSILFYPPQHAKFHDIEHLRHFKPTYVIKDFKEILKIVD